MDALDRVVAPGRDLLGRVDAALVAAGAPPGDPIWPLLRRVGALPGDALEFAVGLDAEPMLSAAAELRSRSRDFGDRSIDLTARIGSRPWTGSGAETFTALWRALGSHIGDGAAADQPSITGRLLAMSSYLDSVAHWMTALRTKLAVAVASALISAEAVTLRAAAPSSSLASLFDTPGFAGAGLGGAGLSGAGLSGAGLDGAGLSGGVVVRAAAAVGVRVLDVVVESLRAGHDLHDEWAPALSELPYRPPADTHVPVSSPITRVEL
jgi:hypothetical protein